MKIGIYVPIVVKQKQQLLRLGKMDVKVLLQALITTNFVGKVGNYNYTCRKCDAEVYLTSSTSPSASKCCATGGTHSWYHK